MKRILINFFPSILWYSVLSSDLSWILFLDRESEKNTAINRPQHEIFILTSEWPCQCPYIGVCAFDLFYIYAVVSQLKSIKHILNWNKTLHFDMFVDISIDINIDTLRRQFVWRLCVRKEKHINKFKNLNTWDCQNRSGGDKNKLCKYAKWMLKSEKWNYK